MRSPRGPRSSLPAAPCTPQPDWESFCGSVVASTPGDSDFVRAFLEQHLQPYRVLRVTGRKRRENRPRHRLLRAAAARLARTKRRVRNAAVPAPRRPAHRRPRRSHPRAQGQARARSRGRQQGGALLQPRCVARGARARGPRDRLDRQRARCLPARSTGIGPCSANYRRDHPPAVRGPERASLPLDRKISRRPGRHDTRPGEHAGDPRVAGGQSAAPARSARQQSERGVLSRGAAR